MINDYTQEVGLASTKKTVPRPLAITLLAIIAAGISYGIVGVVRETKEHHRAQAAVEAGK
jgi:hypothetical protein